MQLPKNHAFIDYYVWNGWRYKCVSSGVGYWPDDWPRVQIITESETKEDKEDVKSQ